MLSWISEYDTWSLLSVRWVGGSHGKESRQKGHCNTLTFFFLFLSYPLIFSLSFSCFLLICQSRDLNDHQCLKKCILKYKFHYILLNDETSDLKAIQVFFFGIIWYHHSFEEANYPTNWELLSFSTDLNLRSQPSFYSLSCMTNQLYASLVTFVKNRYQYSLFSFIRAFDLLHSSLSHHIYIYQEPLFPGGCNKLHFLTTAKHRVSFLSFFCSFHLFMV